MRLPITKLVSGLVCASIALLCLGPSTLFAAPPPGGAEIVNVATADYKDAGDLPLHLNSQPVKVIVASLQNFTLAQRSVSKAIPFEPAFVVLELTHFGNVPGAYTFAFRNLSGDNFDLSQLQLFWDENKNGLIDSELELPNNLEQGQGRQSVRAARGSFDNGILHLQPNETVSLIVRGLVPQMDGFNLVSKLEFAARNGLNETQTLFPELTRGNAAVLRIAKVPSTQTPKQRENLGFTLTMNNIGEAAAVGIPVQVDSTITNLVVLRDLIPANTSFKGVEGFAPGRVLYHLLGRPLHQYQSFQPNETNAIDAIAFGYDQLLPGQSVSATFTVSIHENAAGQLSNIATGYQQGEKGDGEETILSNPINLTITSDEPQKLEPTLIFYKTTNFTEVASSVRVGLPVNLQAVAAACNTNATTVERHTVRIVSKLPNGNEDVEHFEAVETEPNSGQFRVTEIETVNALLDPGVSGDNILAAVGDGQLVADIDGCGVKFVLTTVLIDPAGVVMDSRTCEPVPGVTVTLIDVTGQGNGGRPGGLAVVFEENGRTPAPNPVVTDPEGRYQFPLVAPSMYKMVLNAPASYTFPATNAVGCKRPIHPTGSYGGVFEVSEQTGVVFFDLPVDFHPGGGGGFFVQKTVSKSDIELGDPVDYTVRVKNGTGVPLTGVKLQDILPAGFKLVPGSSRMDGQPMSDPEGTPGSQLIYMIGTIDDGKTVTITYRARVGPGAMQGTGINQAQATSDVPAFPASNVAMVRVRVQEGVFTTRGVIIGKVFVDDNRNREQDPEELGIPGVRLYLEDGSFVITDSEGKFSIYGMRAVTHVMKLDPITLPKGAQLLVLSTRNAGDPGSRFVDLKPGELHKANFAVAATPAVIEEVKQRRSKGEVVVAEIDRTVNERLNAEGTIYQAGDRRALPATGFVGTSAPGTDPNARSSSEETLTGRFREERKTNVVTQPIYTPLLPTNTLNSGNSVLPDPAREPILRIPLEQAMTNSPMDNTLGFIDLKDGDTLSSPHILVRIKGPMGAQFALLVNGEEVPMSRVGKKAVLQEKQLEAWEYIGVRLNAGENTIDLQMSDPFGNVRGKKTIKVIAPDRLGKIRLILPKKEQRADGATPARIGVVLEDSKGVPVTARTPLTLEASLGRWNVEDLDKREPGVQVFMENGKGEFELLPPGDPGDSRIIVSSGSIRAEESLPFLPDLRPMLAVGVVEGTINVSKLNRSALVPARSQDGFEEELREFAVSGNDNKTRAGGRAAFFLKGKIKGEYLLTAGYDSEKAERERLFRDIQPDEFYPVYGDSSIRGYDAQSTGRLYVRIDNKKSYLLYGDFNTMNANPEVRGLGNYNRSLTGIKEHYEKNRLSVNVWASQDSTRQVIEETPANGTSGPYFFRVREGIVNSEKIEILTRDRHQPSQILKIEPQTRFADYEFEPFTGRILFKRPVPSLDPNLNPISIRITYEVDQGGDKFWVYGADGQVKVTKHLEIGGSAVRDENPEGEYQLYSANTTLKLTDKTFLIGEVAQSDTELGGVGKAGRAEFRHQGEKTDLRVYVGKTEETFTNAASILLPGRLEGGAKVRQKIDDKTAVVAQGLITQSDNNEGDRKGVRVDVERTIGPTRLEIGGRHSIETANPASPTTVGATPNEVTSARMKFTTPVPKLRGASIYGEYENDVVEPDKRMVAVGGDYQLANKTKLYARHEFINALGGPFELNTIYQQNTTVVGLETDYMKDGTLFNEYRARSAFSGREAEAATGLRNLWNVAEGVRLNTTFERITPMKGEENLNEATAVSGAIEYTRNPLWKGTARLELRTATQNQSLLNTLGYARKINKDWTWLSKTILMLMDNTAPGAGDRNQGRFQTGFAYRQTETDKWHGLAKYEYKYEEDETQPKAALRRNVNILSLDANYQPNADWIFSGHYAGKYAMENSMGIDDEYIANLVGGRVSYEPTKRWDIGFNFNTLFSGAMDSQQFSFGPEVGFLVKNNLRIAVGYNLSGFRDDDLDSDGYTNPGFFVNLRLKFDETLFGHGNNSKEKKD